MPSVEGALSALASDPSRELDVLWHDGHPLGVDGAQVGVLEEADQVGLGSLLKWERTRSSIVFMKHASGNLCWNKFKAWRGN